MGFDLIRYFLGANTAQGFVSLYDDLADPEGGDSVWYIKGGPGNGKSTFMKTIADAAEAAGRTVERFPCSGDPDSLDGIYIREDRVAYVDATSPHVQEPSLPGAAGQYLDLSRFYRPGLSARREEIGQHFRLYREQYARCYELLRAAALCAPENTPGLVDGALRKAVSARARETSDRLLLPGDGGRERRRFLSALTCQGPVTFQETVQAYGRICILDNVLGLADPFLKTIREECRGKGVPVILCPDPLRPDLLEAVLLPSQDLAFVTGKKGLPRPGPVWRHFRLDAMADDAALRDRKTALRACSMLRAGLLQQAEEALKNAKRFHDALEELYHPYVDFKGVSALCREHRAALGYSLS